MTASARTASAGTGHLTGLLPIASPRRTWAALWTEVRALPWLGLATAVTSVGASAGGLVAPWVLGDLIDDIAAGAARSSVLWATVVIAAAALVTGVLTAVSAALLARLGETVLARLRERVLDRTLHLPAATLDKVGTGDLLSRVGDDVSVVTTALVTTGPTVASALLTIVLTGAGMFALDWRLGLAGLVAVPMYVLAVRWYLPRSGPFYARERVAIGERAQAMVSSLQSGATVRAYRLEAARTADINDRSRAAMDLSIGVFRLFTRLVGRMNRAELVGLAAILVTGFLLVRADLVTVGATTAAALYFHRLFDPIGAVIIEFDEIQAAGASLARLVGVASLDPPEPPAAPPRAGRHRPGAARRRAPLRRRSAPCWRTSPCGSNPASGSRSSARPGPASRRSPASRPGCWNRPQARYGSAACRSASWTGGTSRW